MVKPVPVPSDEPPVESGYQLIVPMLVIAPKSTVPVSQREPSVMLVMVGIVLIVAVTAALVAVVQTLSVAST